LAPPLCTCIPDWGHQPTGRTPGEKAEDRRVDRPLLLSGELRRGSSSAGREEARQRREPGAQQEVKSREKDEGN